VLYALLGENFGAGVGHQHSMLKLGPQAAVAGLYGPVVFGHIDIVVTERGHWLNSNRHAGQQAGHRAWPARRRPAYLAHQS
jgi:hypothetical protein